MIGSFTVLEASAASTVDLFQNEPHRTSPFPRKIVGFGLVGGAACGDAAVELRVSGQIVSKVYNTSTGAGKIPTVENDIQRLNVFVPGGAIVQAQIVDPGATNVLACTIMYEAARIAPPRRFSGRRSSFRRSRRF